MKILRVYIVVLFSLICNHSFTQSWVLDNTSSSGGLTIETYYNEQYNGEVVSCYGFNNGEIKVEVTSGTGPYMYAWDGSAGNQSTAIATNVGVGSYTIVVMDLTTGDVASAQVAFTGPTIIDIFPAFYQLTPPTCSDDVDGQIRALLTGGTGSIAYQWDAAAGNQTTFTATNLGVGNFQLIATDDNGCQFDSTFVIDIPTAVLPNIEVTSEGCGGGTDGILTAVPSGGTVSGPGDYTFQWDAAAGNQTTAAASNLAPGNYSVTVLDANGCSGVESFTLNPPTAITSSTSETQTSCATTNDGSSTITVTGGLAPYNLSWTGPSTDNPAGDEIAVDGGSYIITPLAPGNYSVTITDASGCTESESFTITSAVAVSQTNTKTHVTCNGDGNGVIDFTVSGGSAPYDISWTGPANGSQNDVINVSGGNYQITGLSGGDYDVTITDDNGCILNSNSNTINEPSVLDETTTTSDVSCSGGSDGSINIVVTGGTAPYDISWTGTANGSQNDAINIDGGNYSITSLADGNYAVTITDDNICQIVVNKTIFDPQPLTVSISSKTDVSCNGLTDGSATATVGGGTLPYDYSWSNGQTTLNTIATTNSVSNLSTGLISVTVTDGNGCSLSDNETITEPTAVSASMGVPTMVLCNGGSDGSVIVTGSGGTVAGDYTYLWDDGSAQTTATASNLQAGNYTVTVKDDNNCQTIAGPVTITEPNILSQNNTTNDVSCNGGSDGSIGIVVTGGTAPYDISWTGTAN
jgi:hypothetical protein